MNTDVHAAMDHTPTPPALDRAGLEAWCAHLGIATAYNDIWGETHAASDETLHAILRALEADTTPSVAAASSDVAHLPSVAVVPAGASPWTIDLPLPLPSNLLDIMASNPTVRLRFALFTEDGQRHAGWALLNIDEQRGARLACDVSLTMGYHRLTLEHFSGSCRIIAAPAHAYRPHDLPEGERTWGPAVQLYSLRSARNWGIGDFGDLAEIARVWAAQGAGIIGLNPLHALYAHNPAHCSPYSPSSRLRLNALYIDVEALTDFAECRAAREMVASKDFQARLTSLRAAELVDYRGVAEAKFSVLRVLYDFFCQHHVALNTPHAQAFSSYRRNAGVALRQHALFEALQAHWHAQDGTIWGWPVWPAVFRDPASREVAEFEREHEHAIGFHEYLQWQAENQLAAVQADCRARGMAVGLYLDLAISVDTGGSDTWSHARDHALSMSVGAPPDEVNAKGQDWGLPPLRPDRLRATGYQRFIEILRTSMRQAGALRIDHVMGLMRLFWIPRGHSARDGAYVRYALDEMAAIVALESQRNACMVIGEDLGTVADALRAKLAEQDVLSYQLLYFERKDDGGFKPVAAFREQALAALTTHDLPTLAGWWSGHDLEVRRKLNAFPSEALYLRQRAERAIDRPRLIDALREQQLLPADFDAEAALRGPLPEVLIEAVHAYLAMTPSRVLVVQLEDLLALEDQANLPGTVDEHPNWRRKLDRDLDALHALPRVRAVQATLARLRPHGAANQ